MDAKKKEIIILQLLEFINTLSNSEARKEAVASNICSFFKLFEKKNAILDILLSPNYLKCDKSELAEKIFETLFFIPKEPALKLPHIDIRLECIYYILETAKLSDIRKSVTIQRISEILAIQDKKRELNDILEEAEENDISPRELAENIFNTLIDTEPHSADDKKIEEKIYLITIKQNTENLTDTRIFKGNLPLYLLQEAKLGRHTNIIWHKEITEEEEKLLNEIFLTYI